MHSRAGWRTVCDEPDQIGRLARFRAEYQHVIIASGEFGTWQARIPETSGETIIVRHRLVELLDRLSEMLGGQP
jgi:hypothetical protein